MGKQRIGECIYCGTTSKLTRDHVVPRSLFLPPRPTNLITVPVCEPCNNSKSRDDDYLRDLLVCDIFGSQSPTAQQLLQKTLSSDRQGSSVIAQNVRANAQFKPLYTQAGLYLGDHPTLPVDSERNAKIFERIARGLYYDARKQRIPDGYEFELLRVQPWDIPALLANFEQHHPNGPCVLGDVFECTFLSATEDLFTTLWLMLFFGRVLFSVSATNPELSKYLSDAPNL